MKSQKNRFSGKGIEIISLAVAVIIWELVADFIIQKKLILPSFTDVLAAFGDIVISGTVFADLGTSLVNFGIGMVAALIIGVPVGIAMGWYGYVDRALDPLIEILRPIPPLAWIPFAIVWLGFTQFSAGFVIFIGAVFPIIINTVAGFKSVPKIYVEAGRVLGCTNNRALIRHIALPSSFPSIAAGIRIAMGVGWMCLVAAELFGVSDSGLGFKIWRHYDFHQMDYVLVYMLVLGFLGLVIDRIFRRYVEGRILRWRKGVVV